MADQPVDLRRRDGGAPGPPAAAPACAAPFASLYLDPAGRVTACCANTWHPLGDLRHQRLAEVWRGEPARRLRERLAGGDLGLGCELCAAEVARGAGESAERRRFEPLGPRRDCGRGVVSRWVAIRCYQVRESNTTVAWPTRSRVSG